MSMQCAVAAHTEREGRREEQQYRRIGDKLVGDLWVVGGERQKGWLQVWSHLFPLKGQCQREKKP